MDNLIKVGFVICVWIIVLWIFQPKERVSLSLYFVLCYGLPNVRFVYDVMLLVLTIIFNILCL